VRAIVTTGPAIDTQSLREAPNTSIVRFVPHHDVLPHASLVVTHAGLGTVMSALGHGVAMVCLPLGRDQFFNAAMVERLGAGHVLAADAGEEAIAAAVRAALDDESRAGAKRMANVLANYGGGADAVDAIERIVTG
jgi:UDP:flavonoid glycosyltransferase YjiC (YdhE family)